MGGRYDLRARIRYRWSCRRRTEPIDERRTEPGAVLHYRFLYGRGVRRRGKSVGCVCGRHVDGPRQQTARTLLRRSPSKDPCTRCLDSVHSEASARTLPADGAISGELVVELRRQPWILAGDDRRSAGFLAAVALVTIIVPLLNRAVPSTSALHVSTYVLTLVGKYMCYAMLALAVDLIWGYCGILSLGHAAFFSLGGYAMGMYLMRQIGPRGVYGDPILPDFMVFLNWKSLPWFWHGFNHFAFAVLMMIVAPATLALVFGWFAFRSRVTGVYLSIITQALSYALMLAFFRNDMGFGGNNGFTDFKDILGFDLHSEGTRVTLLVVIAVALAASYLACRAIVGSRAGRVMRAI